MKLRVSRAAVFMDRPLLVFLLLVLMGGCGVNQSSRGVPPEVESAIERITADLNAERYEKIYSEADELFRREASVEDATAVFKTMRTKLGAITSRTLHSATEQQNSGGDLKGTAFILTYQTNFENAKGMESFTFVERNNQWLLARYRVNSTELR